MKRFPKIDPGSGGVVGGTSGPTSSAAVGALRAFASNRIRARSVASQGAHNPPQWLPPGPPMRTLTHLVAAGLWPRLHSRAWH